MILGEPYIRECIIGMTILLSCSIQFLNEIGLAMQRSDIGLNFATNPDDGEETANIDEFLDVRTCHIQ